LKRKFSSNREPSKIESFSFIEKGVKLQSGFVEHFGSSGGIEWWTPKEIIDTLGLEFDLDPATSEDANKIIGAKHIYTKEDNGLDQDWFGRVWLNPPYTRNEMSLWLEKFVNNKEGVALLFNRSDTKWWHDWIPKTDAILFKKGRVKFLLNGEDKGSSQAPSILVAMGNECVEAIKNFEGLFVDLR
tara:strand:+ start:123 stop:680 length:558 start_codon:yes stop_codon:yes gene_type:complete